MVEKKALKSKPLEVPMEVYSRGPAAEARPQQKGGCQTVREKVSQRADA